MNKPGFTLVEVLIVLLIVAIIGFYVWAFWHLFRQTTLLGAIKWGVLILSAGIGSRSVRSSK